ncbi:MAG TPA: GNAT family N-acetyltransferase [Bacteroidia bacterium]|nr:GNAT family N-acetyltransferase [Bacteroidia bacterium]HNU34268.1 GNAT family N-acetyltransferase [Bacteroidia bacterium]
MNNYFVKKASIADLEQLSTLFNEYRIFYKKESDIAGSKQFLLERISSKESEIFVAENEINKLVGFVQLYPLFSSTRMKRVWLLNDLYVEVNFRGFGLAKLLIDKSKELCVSTNACALILETEKENIIGNQLYLSAEFKKDTLHNFYEWEVIKQHAQS